MHVKLNSAQCVGMVLTLPITGPWQALDVRSDGAASMSGTATISIADSMRFVGTILTSAPYSGRVQSSVVGGAGGLQKPVDGKAYARAPARLVVADLLAAVGESLSTTSDAMDTVFRHWLRASNPMRRELELVLTRLGLGWRILADGTIWAGTETWPTSKLTAKGYTVVDQNEAERRIEIAADVPAVYPGETFTGRHVVAVEHRLSGTRLQTTVTFA